MISRKAYFFFAFFGFALRLTKMKKCGILLNRKNEGK